MQHLPSFAVKLAAILLVIPFGSAVGRLHAADRLYLTTDPLTNLTWDSQIFRELPRQALHVAVNHNLPTSLVDVAAEPQAVAQPDDLVLRVTYTWRPDGDARLQLLDNEGNELAAFIASAQNQDTSRVARYDRYVGSLYGPIQTTWLPQVAQLVSTEISPLPWDPSLPPPAESEQLLSTVDFHHAFLAARATHQEIAQTGESTARLGVLVRAYAHLGESTRHTISRQSSAFFARSLVYSERLIQLAPEDPMTWWVRAYVYTLFGLPQPANESLARADALRNADQDDEPRWVTQIRDLLAMRTTKLFAEVGNDPDSDPRSSYFAWLTVEHAPLPSLVINFGRLALDRNPGAVRVLDVMNDNSGVGMLHRTTIQAPRQLNRLVASLAEETTADPQVRAAAKLAVRQQFSSDALLKLLATLEDQPSEPGQLLPWKVYAAIVRECIYVNGLRRLYFVANQWSVDPSGELAQWLPIVKGHRYAAVYDVFGNATPAQVVDRLKNEQWSDLHQSAMLLRTVMREANIRRMPGRNLEWYEWIQKRTDRTPHGVTRNIWLWREHDPSAQILDQLGLLEVLEAHPDHAVALGYALFDGTKALPPTFLEHPDPRELIEQKHGDNPVVAYGLGVGYLREGRAEDALRMLRQTASVAVDRPVFERMAQAHLKLNDESGWRKTWDTYLAKSEDFGLDHARVSQMVAERLMAGGQVEEALPYSRRAAASYAGWGLQVYVDNLVLLKRYEEASEVMDALAARYGSWQGYHRWVRMTGYGDLELARRNTMAKLATTPLPDNPDARTDIGLFYELEGQLERAMELYEQAGRSSDVGLASAMAALVAITLDKDADQIERLLVRGEKKRLNTPLQRAYRTALVEFRKCIEDRTRAPSREAEGIRTLLESDRMPATKGNICYLLGRIAELNGHPEEAKIWYRDALDVSHHDFTCRSLAAEALRRLGEDWYKPD